MNEFTIERIVDPAIYQPTAEGFYETDLVLNLLPLYVSKRARAGNEPSEGLIVKDDKGEIALCAFRALPFHYLVSTGSAGAARHLGTYLTDKDCPGITGPDDVMQPMVKAWQEKSGKTAAHDMTATFYLLSRDDFQPFKRASGELRLATKEDLEALIPLMQTAYEEMKMPMEEREDDVVRATLSYAIAVGSQLVWDDNGIKATLRGIAHKPTMRYINVATHPDFRGKGYATSLVGSVATGLFNTGFETLMLQADDANPISNRMYVKLGFKPHAKTSAYTFPGAETN